MALVLGTSCGFVATAPTADPTGTAPGAFDGTSIVLKDTSPGTAVKIVEMGWYCDNATEEANYEVGVYAADGAVVPGEAGTRLFVDATNAKGTGSGWKVVTGLDWTISPSTVYWLAAQLDDTATATNIDSESAGGSGFDSRAGQASLGDPYGGGAILDTDGMVAIYAVWEAAAAGGGTITQLVGPGGLLGGAPLTHNKLLG